MKFYVNVFHHIKVSCVYCYQQFLDKIEKSEFKYSKLNKSRYVCIETENSWKHNDSISLFFRKLGYSVSSVSVDGSDIRVYIDV